MRKLFFTLAFVLVTSIGFANDNIENKSEELKVFKELKVVDSDYTIITKILINEDFECYEYHAIFYRGTLVKEFLTVEEGNDCGYTGHYLS
ncbi:hypothetical protein [Cellulophaga baltica]|uniref:hypothetical protein n=1 Tax=Cellulophaga baltica TaxID=76594 RepID=UPI002494B3F2|nr:hypothetical protein [Cellulophaga baltica]